MVFRKYLGSLLLISVVFFSVSCGGDSGNNPASNPLLGKLPDSPLQDSTLSTTPKSLVGFVNLNTIGSSLSNMAFWEGKDVTLPSNYNFPISGCWPTRLDGGFTSGQPSLGGGGSSNTGNTQSNILALLMMNNIRVLNPNKDIFTLFSLGNAMLKDNAGHSILNFEQSNTTSLTNQETLPAKGPFYKAAPPNTTIPSGFYTLHFDVADVPVEIANFQLNNVLKNAPLKPDDLSRPDAVKLQWQASGDARATMYLSVSFEKITVGRSTSGVADLTGFTCNFLDTGSADIAATELRNLLNGQNRKIVKIRAHRGFLKFVKTKNASFDIGLEFTISQMWEAS